jgi:gas vesicle protein
MSNGKALLGLVAGVAVGVTLGILFAPDKGSNTVKKISKKGDDYSAELGEKFNAFVDTITKKLEAMQGQAFKMVDHGKEQVKDTYAEIQSGANKKMHDLK